MLVNLILAVLICAYVSMALEDLYIENFKLYGFENF
jgi:DNA-binding XRE family transcriptional regulator